ncbi:oxygen-independent coproporphyrinogen III oxidase [Erythrobacter sp. SCSIO 43205]|uniref:oxygen-independent coproporphyrinogen III oxidase n=1 Tax=Erythrobacter sp. SCSIO 43205 TaxID=2779361 RepID=UPI001CA8E6BE|nr:oxygen-independent coproporphyrinogen III oxidase [Erythrobacter sp. SCSIO 43205]UAB78896.1 oxygen-independent coproporphyrinogen III oxidase [Erythrobacter sp. SCSIO 43205]
MWPYYPELLETPVPRYTSYPTAADFGELSPRALETQIEQTTGDISLYVHIPFCEKICFYCGCNTAASGRRQRVESYLSALHAQIETVAKLLPREAGVRRIAFGGGSPNAILPSEFLDLVDALNRHFWLHDTQWSIEIDPRTMSGDWSEVIGEAGITRASLGVQTFAAHCQKAIGREQGDGLICQTVQWLRDAGVTSLNFDLMYGLPHQTLEDVEESLDCAQLLGADRIALFGYAHVPHIIPRQRVIDASALPGKDTRFAMARQGFGYLTSHGYEPVGFDHFAKSSDPLAVAARRGTLNRNFQGFTDDTAPVLIGLGSSAINVFPDLIVQNEKNSGRYRMLSSQGLLCGADGIVRSAKDQMIGDVIKGLLCQNVAQLTPCLLADQREALSVFLERELARLDGLTLTITPEGLPYARTIASLFDPYRKATTRQFSSAI